MGNTEAADVFREAVLSGPAIGESGVQERRIIVATIIDSYNYGTVLQAIATKWMLEPYGNVWFADYCRDAWTRRGWANGILGSKDHSKLVNLVRLAASVPNRMAGRQCFRSSVERNLPLCDVSPLLTGSELDDDAVYCVGSDQTWNYFCNYGIDPVYFLSNVPDSCFKMSLCASFGRDRLRPEEVADTQRLLSGFDAISVRETSSVRLLERIGVLGVALKDPVVLCDPGSWQAMAAPPKSSSPYVLVYQLGASRAMERYATKLASDRGLRVVRIATDYKKRVPEGWDRVLFPSIEEWLGLFANARYIVTDSFHGTCFAIVMHRPMTVFLPASYSVRLADVLDDFELGNRVADGADGNVLDIAEAPIEWELVDARLLSERARGREFLDSTFRHKEENSNE